MSTEWIEWKGGATCPIDDPYQETLVKFRCGAEVLLAEPKACIWVHTKGPYDIVAYKDRRESAKQLCHEILGRYESILDDDIKERIMLL